MIKIQPAFNIHDIIKPLYYISRWTCLWPYKYDKNNEIIPLSINDKIKACILMSTIFSYSSWIIYLKLKVILETDSKMVFIIETVYMLCVLMLTMLSLALANFKNGELTRTYFLQLDCIKRKTGATRIFNPIYKKLVIQLIVIYSVGLSIVVLDIALYINVDYVLVIEYLGIYVSQNMLLIVVLQILYKLEFLIWFFKQLNDSFEKSLSHMFDNEFIRTNTKVLKCTPKHIRELCKVHKELCNLIQTVNDAHGWQIVILFWAVSALCLNSLYFGIVEGVGDFTFMTDTVMKIEKALLFKEIVNVLFHLALFTLLSAKCSFATEEALKSGTLANNTLLGMELNNRNKLEHIYKEQLQFLVQHITYRNLHFSAANIFTINYRMVSMLAATVTTYFILCVQFRTLSNNSN